MIINDIVKIKKNGKDVKIISLKQSHSPTQIRPVIYATVIHLENGAKEILPINQLIERDQYKPAKAEDYSSLAEFIPDKKNKSKKIRRIPKEQPFFETDDSVVS